MAFDSQQYMAALQPPTFIALNGRKYVGRILSVDEWQPYQIQMRDAGRGDGTVDWNKLRKVMYNITKALFPKPWWKFWERGAIYWLRKLPPVGQMRAVWDFMQSQAKALGMELKPTPGMLRLLGLSDTGSTAGSPTAG